MTAVARRRIGPTACVVLLLSQGPQSAQDLTSVYAPLALSTETAAVEPLRWCGTPADRLRRAGVVTAGPLDDGRLLRADQFPRHLSPTHTGDFGLSNLLVLGDHETLTFERVDPDADSKRVAETWTRTGTNAVAGRMVSVFNPTWSVEVLRGLLRRYSWGVDHPYLLFGDVVAPGAASAAAAPAGAVAPGDRQFVYLQMTLPNLPEAVITQVADDVQFSSDVVNIWGRDYGDSRVSGGDTAFDLESVAQTFYEHFADDYDVLAVVSQHTEFTDGFGFHRVVRNPVTGLGLPIADDSAAYGSNGVLQAVEGYPPGGFASNRTMLHETAHQWSEYSGVWDAVTLPVSGARSALDRRGHDPEGHTPLLYPGEVLAGAVLEATRRVAEQDGEYTIEPTTPTVVYNPLTLYRMGLTALDDLPAYQVFVDQGQFVDENGSASSEAPAAGTPVTGERVAVTANDLLAADGARDGPVVDRIRRAAIVVSRAGLLSPEELRWYNFFAARFGETAGVTSWDRYPSFSQATGGRAVMTTDIRPKAVTGTVAAAIVRPVDPIEPGPDTQCHGVARNALVGFLFDDPIAGCLPVGDFTVTGELTLTDRDDYSVVCLGLDPYVGNAAFSCASVSGNRFSVTLSPVDTGTYQLETYAFFDTTPQYPTSSYRVIEVR